MIDDVEISIVIPCFDEEDNIGPLTEEIVNVMEGESFEVILVSDGSGDGTWKEICRASTKSDAVKGIKLSRNFGHQHALFAGLIHASGEAIVSMDGDFQHPPEVIPALLEKWREGYKIVRTMREDKDVAPFFKRTTSKYFYRFFSRMTDVDLSEGTSDFRLISRQVLETITRFNDVDLFWRAIVSWVGFETALVTFTARERRFGQSKYNLAKMIKFARGAIISFSIAPLQFGISIGIWTSIFAFLEIVFVLISYLMGNTLPGWASTIGIVSFLFGILFIILGIIGTYVARIHQALQARPRFVVDDTVNLAKEPPRPNRRPERR